MSTLAKLTMVFRPNVLATIAVLGLIMATLVPAVLAQVPPTPAYDSRDCYRTYTDENGMEVTVYYGRCPEGYWCKVYFDEETNGWKAECIPLS